MNEGQGVCECARCPSTKKSNPSNSLIENAEMATEIASPHLPPGYVIQSYDEWLEERRTQLLRHMENVDGEKSIIARYFEILEDDKFNEMDIAYDPKLDPLDPSLRSLTTQSSHDEMDFNEMPHSFEPRIGEVILFLPNEEPDLVFHEATETYVTRNGDGEEGFPRWMAGVVVELPLEHITLRELRPMEDSDDPPMLIKVEMLTVHGSRDKKVECHSILSHRQRPFSMFRELLNGYPQSIWHKSIRYAMDATASVSHCSIYRFSGEFPYGKFSCRGIWIGNEMFCRGDAARLLPSSDIDSVREVLIIRDIYIKMTKDGSQLLAEYILEGPTYSLIAWKELHEESPLKVEPEHFLYATAYAIDLSYIETNATYELPTSMCGYSFDLSSSAAVVGPESILGRLYEREAMGAMINSWSLNVGLDGVCEARKSMALKRCEVRGESPARDFKMNWARDRIEMLGVKCFGNVDFSERAGVGTPEELTLRKLSLEENEDAESDEDVDGGTGVGAVGTGYEYAMEPARDGDTLRHASKRPRTT